MIIIGAEDAGAARYLAALYDCLDYEIFWVGSDISNPIFSTKGINPTEHWEELKNIRLVITGTSLGWGIDKQLIEWATFKKIPSISIIDHWNWYKKRFEFNGDLFYPDRIIINDEYARSEAIKDGIPKRMLVVGGNPQLEELLTKSTVQFDASSWKLENNLPDGRLIAFICESLKDDFPLGSRDYLGYDEFLVLEQILDVLPLDTTLLIKLHPEELEDKYKKYTAKNVFIMRDCPLGAMVSGIDLIVGMGSILLIELAMLRKDIVSFRPEATDSFVGEIIDATHSARNKSELLSLMQNPKYFNDNAFKSKFKNSSKRILAIIKSMI